MSSTSCSAVCGDIDKEYLQSFMRSYWDYHFTLEKDLWKQECLLNLPKLMTIRTL